jgi:hypothetical protein
MFVLLVQYLEIYGDVNHQIIVQMEVLNLGMEFVQNHVIMMKKKPFMALVKRKVHFLVAKNQEQKNKLEECMEEEECI